MEEFLLLVVLILIVMLIVIICEFRSVKKRIKELKAEQEHANREILKRIYEIKNMIDGDV